MSGNVIFGSISQFVVRYVSYFVNIQPFNDRETEQIVTIINNHSST